MNFNTAKQTNTENRILYLDIARGLALFFMVMQHAMIMHVRSGGEGHDIVGNFFIVAGTAPAAPVFLLIMGLFLGLSKSSIKHQVKRGAVLFFGGYLLNFFRFGVPLMLAGQSLLSKSVLPLIGEADIFQLAGLSLIFLAPIKNKKLPSWALPAIAVIIAVISPWLWKLQTPFADINPFWGTGDNVSFPFFPWCIYPILGLYLSPLLTSSEISYGKMLQYSLITFVLGILTVFITPVKKPFYQQTHLIIEWLWI